MKIKHISILTLTASVMLFSCDPKKDEVKPTSEDGSTLTVNTVKNLPADPNNKGHYTFFSFKDNAKVNLSDSATLNWDIAFKATTIIVNGGTSGPGDGAAQIYTGIFNDLIKAPSDGYVQDNHSSFAIPTGSSNGWYNYNSTTHVISAIPGRVLVFKTAQGRYAKVEIISYYKDFPANPTSEDIARYYTFRFAYQDDGSKTLQ